MSGGKPRPQIDLAISESDLPVDTKVERLTEATRILLEIAYEHDGPWRMSSQVPKDDGEKREEQIGEESKRQAPMCNLRKVLVRRPKAPRLLNRRGPARA